MNYLLILIVLLSFTLSLTSCTKPVSTVNHQFLLSKNDRLNSTLYEYIEDEFKKHHPLKNVSLTKFSMPYFLIPEEEINYMPTKSIDDQLNDQLFLRISGVKYYKYFIHPEAIKNYSYLKNSFHFIDENKTEFFATQLGTPENLIVWNRNNDERTPFMIRISINKSLSKNNIEKRINTVKLIEKMAQRSLANEGHIFAEAAGIVVKNESYFSGQIVFKLPSKYALKASK